MTEAEHVAQVKERARDLADAITEANDAGVSHAVLLPELLEVFRDANMVPEGLSLPGF